MFRSLLPLMMLAGCPTEKDEPPADETDTPGETDTLVDTDEPQDSDTDEPLDSDDPNPQTTDPFCADGCVWESTQVLPLSSSSGAYDTRFDASGVLHILTGNRLPDGLVQLHTEASDDWTVDDIALWDGQAVHGLGVALSFDGDDPQVVWSDRMHRFATRTGDAWSIEDVGEQGDDNSRTLTMRLLTGSDGRVHWLRQTTYEIYNGNLWSQGPALPGSPRVAALVESDTILLYTGLPWQLTTAVAAEWEPVAVNTDGEPAVSSMAVRPTGDVRVVTSDRGEAQEEVRLWTGGQTGTTIANTADGIDPRCVQLAIDEGGLNHVTWVDSGGVLQYSYGESGDWTTIPVTDIDLTDCTLLLRSSGAPVIIGLADEGRTWLTVLEPTVP